MDFNISFNDCHQLWEKQPSFLITQGLYLFGGFCTLLHAISNGHQWLSLWLVTVINGIVVELVSFYSSDVNSFWHSQGPVMLFDKRLPLGIVFVYPCMYYISMVCVSVLNLRRGFEPLAAGLFNLLIDMPGDIVGIKYLHWNWHDSDPNILERSYSVPWNSYTFHFLFSVITCFVCGPLAVKNPGTQNMKLFDSLLSWFLGVTISVPMAYLAMSFLYNLLHDMMKIHSQIIFLMLFSISCALLWREINLRKGKQLSSTSKGGKAAIHLKLYLFLHYSLFVVTSIVYNPQEQISTGFHQPIGNCQTSESMRTVIGLISPIHMLKRKKYLCWQNHSQTYFDFHCVPDFKPEGQVTEWYTICGTPHENKAEFVTILIGVSLVAYIVFQSVFEITSNNVVKKHKKA